MIRGYQQKGLQHLPTRRAACTTSCRASKPAVIVRDVGDSITQATVSAATFILNALNRQPPAPPKQVKESAAKSKEEMRDRLEKEYLERQYFVTGDVDMSLYAEDCIFSDPSIKGFKGVQRYVRNLTALKGFFIVPSITLYDISACPEIQNSRDSPSVIKASWRLMVSLKLPWKPKIDILGSTTYELDSAETKCAVIYKITYDVNSRTFIGVSENPAYAPSTFQL